MYYPFSLMMVGMNSNKYEDVLSGMGLKFLIFSIGYTVLFSAVGIGLLSVRDVKA